MHVKLHEITESAERMSDKCCNKYLCKVEIKKIKSQSSYNRSSVKQHPYYHVRQKTAPFYLCDSLVKTSSVMTIFGTHIQYFSNFPITCVFNILYVIRDREPA